MAVLEVTDVSTDSAACKVVDGVADLDVGDLVRLPIRGDGNDTGPVAAYEVPETIMVVRPSAEAIREIVPARSMSKATVNGRVGVRYLMVQDRNPDGGEFSQPALDLRLDALNMAEAGAGTITDMTSCPGTDTCKLGISASRGVTGELRKRLTVVEDQLDPAVKALRMKASGCFNSCGQHHAADIGFTGVSRQVGGRRVPHFNVVLGGQWTEPEGQDGANRFTADPWDAGATTSSIWGL